MKVLDAGHKYQLASIDGEAPQVLTFVKRFRGTENHAGTTNQEVIRSLIDRVEVLHAERPHHVNQEIIKHLRLALVLHEVRALERKVEHGEIEPEDIEVSQKDGHFKLTRTA